MAKPRATPKRKPKRRPAAKPPAAPSRKKEGAAPLAPRAKAEKVSGRERRRSRPPSPATLTGRDAPANVRTSPRPRRATPKDGRTSEAGAGKEGGKRGRAAPRRSSSDAAKLRAEVKRLKAANRELAKLRRAEAKRLARAATFLAWAEGAVEERRGKAIPNDVKPLWRELLLSGDKRQRGYAKRELFRLEPRLRDNPDAFARLLHDELDIDWDTGYELFYYSGD